MDIKYLLDDAHRFFNGRIDKDSIQRNKHQYKSKQLKHNQKDLHSFQDYSSMIYSKVKYETSKKIRLKAIRIFSHGNTI